MFIDIEELSGLIQRKRESTLPTRSVLVGISGIDGSGKGYLSKRLVELLKQRGIHAIHLNVDGWLNLPHKRFSTNEPARHFYQNAIRFDAMFEELILPLKRKRSISLEADFAEETASEFLRHHYEYEDVQVIVLEGIFLFQEAYRSYFDLAVWIDCSFETALKRALERRQEGLTDEETIRAYKTMYFPAQRIHFSCDHPRQVADVVINNDPILYETPA